MYQEKTIYSKIRKLPYAWKTFIEALNNTQSKKQFSNTISMAKEIAQENPKALVDLVKLIGKPYQTKHISGVVMKGYNEVENLDEYLVFFPKGSDYTWELYSLINEVKDYKRPLELKTDLILPWPWSKKRIRDTLCGIGKRRSWGEWQEDKLNHRVSFWLPMGIGWVKGGNHSISNGIINGEGVITQYKAYDISAMYEYVYCDGDYFYKVQDDSKLFPVQSLEFACIFEIGRIMHENGISA